MRKLLLLTPLVLVAVLWLNGCDETPVEPQSANAATVTQEGGTAPAFKTGDKPPTLPTPVTLSGLEIVENERPVSIDGPSTSYAYAPCPDGKKPISGGYEFVEYGSTEVKLMASRPYVGSSFKGWMAAFYATGTGSIRITASAVCMDAS